MHETINREKTMTFMKSIMGAVAAVAFGAAASAQPAIIFDLGGKFDKSFNEAAYAGAERFRAETGVEYREFELQSEAQREQALRRFAQAGNNPVVMTGFSYASALEAVAPDFPDTNFVIVDMVVEGPNVRSVVFNEHEGSYLVGLLAAMASKTGKVGFVGGMDIPLIRKFACGYVQGVKAANPDAVVFQNMTGTTGAAWNDPVKGGELTKAQIDQGADVIYHAAGGTGRGVLQAAADAGVLGIGVDSNQNYMQPGSVLTSMLKRVDVAVYNAFKDGAAGKFTPGLTVMGLANRGVGFAVDEYNKDLLTDAMTAAVYKAAYDIATGEIVVHDYMSDSSCPVN
jgi:basic membrane protein A and related proteins